MRLRIIQNLVGKSSVLHALPFINQKDEKGEIERNFVVKGFNLIIEPFKNDHTSNN